MNSQVFLSIGITVVALVLILVRQLRERPVREERGMRGVLILAVIGLYQIGQYAMRPASHMSLFVVLFVVIGFISACFFGWLRARETHIWRDKGQLMAQGNWLTITWWIVALAVHFGIEFLGGTVLNIKGSDGLASASIVLYVALSLGAQKYVLLNRGKEMVEDQPKPAKNA